MRAALLPLVLLACAGIVAGQPEQAWLEVRVEPVTLAELGDAGAGNVTVRYRHGPAVTLEPTIIDLATSTGRETRIHANVSPARLYAEVNPAGGEVVLNTSLLVRSNARLGCAGPTLAVELTTVAGGNANLPAVVNNTTAYIGMPACGGADERILLGRGPQVQPGPGSIGTPGLPAALALAGLSMAAALARRR